MALYSGALPVKKKKKAPTAPTWQKMQAEAARMAAEGPAAGLGPAPMTPASAPSVMNKPAIPLPTKTPTVQAMGGGGPAPIQPKSPPILPPLPPKPGLPSGAIGLRPGGPIKPTSGERVGGPIGGAIDMLPPDLRGRIPSRGGGTQKPPKDTGIVYGEEKKPVEATEESIAKDAAAADKRTIDERMEDALKNLLSGTTRSTAEEEKLIQEMLQGTIGQGQADLNARMARAGFGTSGALAAIGGDLRAQAARAAAGEIMGVRAGARGELMEQLGMGLEAQGRERELAMQEDAYDRYLKALEEMWGTQPRAPGTPNVTTVVNREGEEVEVVERPGESFQKDVEAAKYGGEVHNSATVGEDWVQIDTDRYGNTIWEAPDGTLYKVPAGWENQ